jgi:translocon-associated protein subunit alpha
MDFTYHIQNFSAIAYAKVVKPKQQATVAYSFIPADAFAGRPIGLTINLQYRDAAGNFFIDPVFNETVQIVEFDEGFDTETFFMYVTLGGSVILLLFLGFNFIAGQFSVFFKKKSSVTRFSTLGFFSIKQSPLVP